MIVPSNNTFFTDGQTISKPTTNEQDDSSPICNTLGNCVNQTFDDATFLSDLLLTNTFDLESEMIDESWFKTFLQDIDTTGGLANASTRPFNNNLASSVIRADSCLMSRQVSTGEDIAHNQQTVESNIFNDHNSNENFEGANLFSDNCMFYSTFFSIFFMYALEFNYFFSTTKKKLPNWT
jgi:hypothetical protein